MQAYTNTERMLANCDNVLSLTNMIGLDRQRDKHSENYADRQTNRHYVVSQRHTEREWN